MNNPMRLCPTCSVDWPCSCGRVCCPSIQMCDIPVHIQLRGLVGGFLVAAWSRLAGGLSDFDWPGVPGDGYLPVAFPVLLSVRQQAGHVLRHSTFGACPVPRRTGHRSTANTTAAGTKLPGQRISSRPQEHANLPCPDRRPGQFRRRLQSQKARYAGMLCCVTM